jgi:hypothetical protein
MKIFKLITSALVAGIIFVFIKQNIPAFTTRVSFTLDLFIREPVNWEHSVYGLIIISVFVGFVAGSLILLRPYMQTRRMLAEKREEKKEQGTPPPPRAANAPEETPTIPTQS